MAKVLLVGNGGREHAIGEALKRSGEKLYAYMNAKNPGIMGLSEETETGDLSDLSKVVVFGEKTNVDYAVIGPEAPLNTGIVDALEQAGIPSVGPRQKLARLECSKSFTRQLLEKHDVPGNIMFKVFETMDGIEDFLEKVPSVAVKPDGLTGGKGVRVSKDHLKSVGETLAYCEEVLAKGSKVVLEEKLEGEEFTLMCFVDGKHVVPMPLVQDHKRAYEDDKGPNTGGMGSYSCADHSLPFVKPVHIDDALETMQKTVEAILDETGHPYKGILYGQFMITLNGPRLVEYNARFGDPEAMNVLSILGDNFGAVCRKIIDGTLGKNDVVFSKNSTVCKYLVPEGYPNSPAKNQPIKIDQKALKDSGAILYYANAEQKETGLYTGSSRTIGLVGVDKDLYFAEEIAERATRFVKGPLFHRRDIGTQRLVEKRVKHLEQLSS